jgi:hypothetical protein
VGGEVEQPGDADDGAGELAAPVGELAEVAGAGGESRLNRFFDRQDGVIGVRC